MLLYVQAAGDGNCPPAARGFFQKAPNLRTPRMDTIKRFAESGEPMSTPGQEDYLEAIWVLTERKGYARVTDLSEVLAISPASASKMVRRLHEAGLLTYERYRGFSFTSEGRKQGRLLYLRHRILVRLLTQLQIGSEADVLKIVEGIEHHFDVARLDQLERLVLYIEQHPDWWHQFLDSPMPLGEH